MTGQRKIFVDEYILTGSGTEAAKRAGYKHATKIGSKLLHEPEVRAAIDKRLAEIDSEKILSQQQLLEFLSSVVRGEVKDETVMTRLIGKGQSIIEHVEYRVPTRERLNAATTLLKIQGAFNQSEEQSDAAKLFVDTLTAIYKKQSTA